MEQKTLSLWLTWAGIAALAALVFILTRAGLNGRFHSVDTLKEYIGSFGVMAPLILIAVQAFQVVVPVLPGFLGCIVGVVLFGTAGGFWCNYIGICAGSIIAFILARCYGVPFVESVFPKKQYDGWVNRLNGAKSYSLFFFLCILLPLAPDDFLCYFSGLIKMPVKKFVLIILSAKPWCLLFYSMGTGALLHNG